MEWSQLQEAFLNENNTMMKLNQRYYTGDLWDRKLIMLLWGIICAQWDHRNIDCHGHNKDENHTISHQIKTKYQVAPHMLTADRDLLTKPIQAKLKKMSCG
jgi:hypothetical protein